MRALYRLVLRLYPARVRAEFGEEMLRVFEEARAAERTRGHAALLRFYCREGLGLTANLLLEERSMKHKRLIIQGALAGLLLGAAFAFAYASRPYTSSAQLRLTTPPIPESLVPSQTRVSMEETLPRILQAMTSRANLARIINTFNLYPSERARKPMEDVVLNMRQSISVRPAPGDSIDLAFSYPDRFLAQKVTMDLAGRLMDDFRRERTSVAHINAQFLKDGVSKAAKRWDEALAAARAAEIARKPADRLLLDFNIARQRYEGLSQKLADAEMLVELNQREQGQSLEVLDSPSLPAEPRTSIFAAPALGAIAGAMLGWVLGWALSYKARASLPRTA